MEFWQEICDSAMKHDRSMQKHIIHMIKDWLWRDRKKVNWWGDSYKRNGK